jgi:hypothetical protein
MCATFAAYGVRVTCFVAKRLHETRPRVGDRVALRPNAFASAPIGIAPAHASTVATATDAITRFDPPFRPRRASFVARAIVVVKAFFDSIVNFQHPESGGRVHRRQPGTKKTPSRVARWNETRVSASARCRPFACASGVFRASKSRRVASNERTIHRSIERTNAHTRNTHDT